MKDFMTNHGTLIGYSLIAFVAWGVPIRFLWFSIIPHIMLSLCTLYDIIKIKRNKSKSEKN